MKNKIYSSIIFDWSYIDKAEDYEDEIQNNVELIELDENFRESYIDITINSVISYEKNIALIM